MVMNLHFNQHSFSTLVYSIMSVSFKSVTIDSIDPSEIPMTKRNDDDIDIDSETANMLKDSDKITDNESTYYINNKQSIIKISICLLFLFMLIGAGISTFIIVYNKSKMNREGKPDSTIITITKSPTTGMPTVIPTPVTVTPTNMPTIEPTVKPTDSPIIGTQTPSVITQIPSRSPSNIPTDYPTNIPSISPIIMTTQDNVLTVAWNLDGFNNGFVNGFIASGYDVIEYFNNNAIKGDVYNSQHISTYLGATFAFKDIQNKIIFDMNPKLYVPQFGGFCAYAVTQGYRANIDPESFTIYNGKLYLNYNNNIRDKWRNNINNNINQGFHVWRNVWEFDN